MGYVRCEGDRSGPGSIDKLPNVDVHDGPCLCGYFTLHELINWSGNGGIYSLEGTQ